MIKEKPVRGSTPQPDHIFISINGDAKTSMTVTWRTSIDVTEGYAEFREEGSTQTQRVQAAADVFESDIDISRMFWAKMSPLKPGTRYFYTCGNDEHRSEEYCFTTQPENLTKFKFLCVSDQQKGHPFGCPDYSHFNKIMKEMLVKHPDTAFILTGGDNTDCGQHESQWNGTFSGMTGFAEYIPFMMTLGNHDNRGFRDYANGVGRYYAEPAEFFNKQFKGSYPDNGPENWKTENYTFDYGNAHFAIMSVNGQDEANDWLVKDLSESSATWKLGSNHFPACYSGCDCANHDIYPSMTQCMDMMDVVFSGHEHSFARSFPRRGEELFEKPSEGTVHYIIGNSNQNPPGTRSLPKVWHTAFYTMEEKTSMIAVVEIDGDKMTITAELEDGRVVDRCVIDKGNDTIEPVALAPHFDRTKMMFKGADMGVCQSGMPCECRDGVWFAPLAVLFGYFGGKVEKTKGQLYLEAYGHSALFTEGSTSVTTDKGEYTLKTPVVRSCRNQLYIPLDAVEIFDMRWSYAPRNNFVLVEIESEADLVTDQP